MVEVQCSLLYTTDFTGAPCVLRTVCSPVSRFILCVTQLTLTNHTSFSNFSLPLHLPIHPSTKSFTVIRSKAHIEYRSPMLKLLNQLSPRFLTMCIVQVDMFIPR